MTRSECMRPRRALRWFGFAALVAALALAAACGSLQPPEECAVPGGSADQTAFAEHFSQMAVVMEGQDASSSVEEPVFGSDDTVEVVATSIADTSTNLCLQERKGGGQIRYDETPILYVGENRVSLGSFGKGDYVVRVIVDDVLVKNLTFTVR
ncbi:MAG: hypothetical protein HY672_02145 [Chloroflexi bacterium]|nr:hypothetical protein [Chloroflexota bacterium]